MGRAVSAILTLVLVAAANFALWAYANRPVHVHDWDGPIAGFAFNAFQRDQSPLDRSYPSNADLESDIALLARYTRRVRSYTSTEMPTLPELAQKYGLKLTAGAWLDRNLERNVVEVDALIRAARAHASIERVIVGNESLLRGDLTAAQIIPHLDRVRRALKVPVSTAEPWHIWLKYPELADHVDYIVVHLLPYWEGVPRRAAVADTLARYDQLQKRFPDKAIVIGEVGWPSNGDRFRGAAPGVARQAQFLRNFFKVAAERQLDYYVMEAFDQPWKMEGEGRTGAYWGMFDASREPKFALTGPVVEDPNWLAKAVLACLLAVVPILWFAWRFARFRWPGKLFFASLIQTSCALLVWSVGVPFEFYLDPVDWVMLGLLLPAQLAILGVLLINGFEFAEVLWRPRWQRAFASLPGAAVARLPKVSIHLACANEPPEMVILTLDSLARLDYPDFEVLVVDNNTEKEEVWRPVAAHCATLGPRFRFFHLNPWPGFKAGALNFALKETAADAEIVGVVDSDYVVAPEWLRHFVPHFLSDPAVAVVQAPQAHMDWEHNAFRRMCNWEFEGFFRIGMHHRNERNAIIQHGTMTLVRREPLERTGGWAEWCICEDAELGLRLMHAGLETRYIDEVVGRGLTPADLSAYKSQRYRWAFGAMQILKRHWTWLTSPGPLDAGQRFHFLTGWFSWFADALHLAFTIMAVFWTLGMVSDRELFTLPLSLFLIPVLGFFLAKSLFGIVLYRMRVPCGWKDTLGAALASMALSHSIALGIFKGLWAKKGEFVRTAKRRRLRKRPSPWLVVREESLIFLALMLSIVAMIRAWGLDVIETRFWVVILGAQSLPYLSAMVLALVAARAGEKS